MLVGLVACLPLQPAVSEEQVEIEQNAELNKTTEIDVANNSTLSDSVIEEKENDVMVKTVMEGDMVSFPNLKANDPDGDAIKYTFSEPLNEKGEWLTKVGDAGEYDLTIIASDGENKITKKIKLIVKSQNSPPVIDIAESIYGKEGEKIFLSPTITDPDNDDIKITYSGFMDSAEYVPTFIEAGSHKVKITATDGQNVAEKEIYVIIEDINRPPVIDTISDVEIKEGDKIIITPTGTDPDNDKIRYSFSTPLDEAGKWQTNIGDAGAYEISVTASDGKATSKIVFDVIVEALNRPPVIVINDVEVEEGDTVKLNPVVTDPEEDNFTITFTGWMTSDSKTTDYEDAGTYTVTVSAEDANGNVAKKDITITVTNKNRPPVFEANAFI